MYKFIGTSVSCLNLDDWLAAAPTPHVLVLLVIPKYRRGNQRKARPLTSAGSRSRCSVRLTVGSRSPCSVRLMLHVQTGKHCPAGTKYRRKWWPIAQMEDTGTEGRKVVWFSRGAGAPALLFRNHVSGDRNPVQTSWIHSRSSFIYIANDDQAGLNFLFATPPPPVSKQRLTAKRRSYRHDVPRFF
jgi:hypothetical protein